MKARIRTLKAAASILAAAMILASPGRAEGGAVDQLRGWAAGLGVSIFEGLSFVPRAMSRKMFVPGVHDYRAVLDQSSVDCTAFAGGLSASATFKRFKLEARVDSGNPAGSRIEATVETASVESSSFWIPNSLLRSKLKTDAYPLATMTSKAIRATPRPNFFDADVEIVLMGETYRQTITVGLVPVGARDLRMSGSLSLVLKDGHRVSQRYNVLLRPAN